jgi:hypothetical protein
MILSKNWPQSHYDVIEHHYKQYDQAIASGQYEHFLYPWGTFGALIVIVYMLIPHHNRPWLRKLRFLVFAWITGFATYSIMFTRANGMAPAFGTGLISAWSVTWIMAILVINDAETDFQRIERTEGVFGQGDVKKVTGSEAEEKEANESQNGADPKGQSYPKDHLGPRQRHGEFAWQPYPMSPFIERLDWVLDIFCNFRGVGWNWRTTSLPPPPKWVQEQLQRNSRNPPQHSSRIRPGQARMYFTRRELLVKNAQRFIFGYVLLDALKTLMNHDPYFWGIVERLPPSWYPNFLLSSPTLLRMYRLAVSQLMIKYALQTLFCLAPLFFCGILGTPLIGARAEAWMYPETWGSYSYVLDRGIAGWWSGWWHQTFRFAFEQPSRKLVEVLRMDRKSPVAKLLQLLVAFGLSGVLHACGSYTQPGPSRPIMGPFRFFMIQAVGIFFEVLLSQLFRKTGVQRVVPNRVIQAFTLVYVHVWFFYTAPLLCDDFARGGIWLFEPVPISVFRGLGFGVKGDGWWCWGGMVVHWVNGKHWWTSGIAF